LNAAAWENFGASRKLKVAAGQQLEAAWQTAVGWKM